MNGKILSIISYTSLKELCSNNGLSQDKIIGNLDENNRYQAIILPDRGYIYGIAYYDVGLKPQVERWDEKYILLVGFDRTFVCISLVNGETEFIFKLPSLLYEFIIIEHKDLIVILCELDVSVLDLKGEIVWTIGFQEIITDHYIKDDKIHIICDDGDETILSIFNGQIE